MFQPLGKVLVGVVVLPLPLRARRGSDRSATGHRRDVSWATAAAGAARRAPRCPPSGRLTCQSFSFPMSSTTWSSNSSNRSSSSRESSSSCCERVSDLKRLRQCASWGELRGPRATRAVHSDDAHVSLHKTRTLHQNADWAARKDARERANPDPNVEALQRDPSCSSSSLGPFYVTMRKKPHLLLLHVVPLLLLLRPAHREDLVAEPLGWPPLSSLRFVSGWFG